MSPARSLLMLVLLSALPAQAGPRKRADQLVAQLDGGRPLAAALEGAGWIATPEGSDRYKPGFVYDSRHNIQIDRARCFAAEPMESLYNELEVVKALEAGARVPLGLVTAEAGGKKYKRLTYADPRVRELAGIDLRKIQGSCAADIASYGDGSWYVVQAVLLAIVNEQECIEASASVRVGGAGGGLDISESCSTASEGQVAVAYKVVPARSLLPGAVSTAPARPLPAPPVPAGGVGSPGGFEANLDVTRDLVDKECSKQAEQVAERQRSARMDVQEQAVRAQATTAWASLAPAAEACLGLDDRSRCTGEVQRFIDWASALQVTVEAGHERVSSVEVTVGGKREPCGERTVPFAAGARPVAVAERATAQAMLKRLEAGGAGESYDVLGHRMVALAGGTFTMGCTAGQSGCDDDEKPAHEVTVSPFWLLATEVTQGLYRQVMGTNPSHFDGCGDRCPVDSVSWYDAVEFCNRLSKREELRPAYVKRGQEWTWDRSADGYRLPTEAEWEYAARAGEDTLYAGGNKLGGVGWHKGNSGNKTHPVGEKLPNGFDLYDMSGNVWEWVYDRHAQYTAGASSDLSGPTSGGNRVVRGGSYRYVARGTRVANRGRDVPAGTFQYLGFRPARGVPGLASPQR
jgi:formylglycine-generating enzyme required for sulfatase activity